MTKAIFFDFDGTLADTAPGIILTMKETFKEMKLPIPDDKAITQTIGLKLYDSIKMLGRLSDEKTSEAVEIYRRLFPTCELTHIQMFPGVEEGILNMVGKGLRLAICTSRGHDSLKRILSRNGLWECFETMVTASDNITPKPAPDMVLALLERMHLEPDEAVVVGDTTFDIEMGKSAGCSTVAVTYGNHSRSQLEAVRPTRIIDNFGELGF